ncbi:MAG: gamma-glutamylcyclotransferase [Lachnospiraceae bacterium]|nr:gamma-glutamylcyclotransferase [Lachnospiraceae bacterium]
MAEKIRFEFSRGLSHKPSVFYLAYGSNLCRERMETRCPNAVAVGTTKIQGFRLLFKRSCSGFYATIEQDANCFVPAAVYKISEYDEALLNRYEGYPKYYYKRYFQLPIRTLAGGRLRGLKQCMAYVLHEERSLGEPSMDYFRLLDSGYETWKFDVEILDKGLSDSIGVKSAKEYIKQFEQL